MVKILKNLLSLLLVAIFLISCSVNESDVLITEKNLQYAENTFEKCLKDKLYKGQSGNEDNYYLYFSITDNVKNIIVLSFYDHMGELNSETYKYKILPYLDRQYVFISLSCIDKTVYIPYLQTLEVNLKDSDKGILYVRVNGSSDIIYKTSSLPYPLPDINDKPSNQDNENSTPNVDNETEPNLDNNNVNKNPSDESNKTPEEDNKIPESDSSTPNENEGNTSPENNGIGNNDDINNNKPSIPEITNPLIHNFRGDLSEHTFALLDQDDKRYRIDICPIDGKQYFIYSYKYNRDIRDPSTNEKLKNPHILLYFNEQYEVDSFSGHLVLNGYRTYALLRSEDRYFLFSDDSSFITNLKIEIKYNTPSSYHVKVTDYEKRNDKDEQWVKL